MVVIQAALLKKVVQSMVVIIIPLKIIRVKRDIIPITALTRVKKAATAKAIILITIMKKAVMKVEVMMKLINTDRIMKVARDRKVENTDTKRDTRKDRRQLDIIISPARMTTTKNTNSTMMLTKREVIINMEAIILITRRKEVKARKVDITNRDIKVIVMAKRVTQAKVTMMTIIKDTKDIMDTKATSLIMTIMERKAAHLEVPNMVSG